MIQVFALVSLLGFADAFYLTVKHFQDQVPPCSLVTGCETVLTSQYATILGIPVSLFGVLFYLSVLILSVWYMDRGDKRALQLAIRLTWLGLLASVYFVYVQLVLLQAVCAYCMLSATTSVVLYGLGVLIKRRTINKTHT
jgi:uncharacterized membrane protein